MPDFFRIVTRYVSKGGMEVYPKFIIRNPSEDLMIRGSDFYAVWLEDQKLWSTNEQDVIRMIDRALDQYVEEYQASLSPGYRVLYMWDSESRMIDNWHRYCQKQMRDSFRMLDESLVFSNTELCKKDYASKKLSYPLIEGPTPSWDRLLEVLYSEEERRKIEWCIGSVVCGASKTLQKFAVFYGAAGTGKSTIIGIIQKLFEGYVSVFDAKALGSASSSFALEVFKNNPLVAIQHDGDLSKIEDNTRLNSLVSHEVMIVNEKFKSAYENAFKCFLFMGTNKPVRITDAKSGLIRRLIDITPTGNKIPSEEYSQLMNHINFELGPIAWKCEKVFLSNPKLYDDYVPINMLGATNDFYNFVEDSWDVFEKSNTTTLKAAWEMYKNYCDDAKVPYPYTQRAFKEELRNYFEEFYERWTLADGTRVRSYYIGFRKDKFENKIEPKKESAKYSIPLNGTKCYFDSFCKDFPAQYASEAGTPAAKWENVTTTLKDIDTTKLHYVLLPENHIVIDFDIKDENGEKSLEKNLEAASKFPPTYTELSKSGKGVHLHYIYEGDVTKLSRIYDNNIEIKVFTGKSALRRKLTRFSSLAIAVISSGLPLRKESKSTLTEKTFKSEKALREFIARNLRKEIHAYTKPSIDFIEKGLKEAYESGLHYDVTDLENDVIAFAAGSTNNSSYCLQAVQRMKFKSEEPTQNVENDSEDDIVIYDIEVFPNLLLVDWKKIGQGNKCIRMFNPSPQQIEEFIRHKLVGFNCRRYDNHIIYARLLGYSLERIYELSQAIINGGKRNSYFFNEAYNISYTDVYDFASAGNKKSLKKFEIELGIHHQELGLPWDQPVPEDKWPLVAEYCDNDVIATEAVFEHLKSDFMARKILASITGMTVNDTTNDLTKRLIFGTNKHPQSEFNYRNLALPVPPTELEHYKKIFGSDYKFRAFDKYGQPLYRDAE